MLKVKQLYIGDPMLVTMPDALFMQHFDVEMEQLEKSEVYEIPSDVGKNAHISDFKKEGEHMERNKFEFLDLYDIGLKNFLEEQKEEFEKNMNEIGNACKELNEFANIVEGVNHPAHYQSQSGLEAIDVIEAFNMGFNLGNVLKYIIRADKKGKVHDLKKAMWYLQREIQNQEEGEFACQNQNSEQEKDSQN